MNVSGNQRVYFQLAITFTAACVFLLIPDPAYAFEALRCVADPATGIGVPEPGTSLYDASAATGACQFTGIQNIFSTVICQFVTMINIVMGKLYCSIQGAVLPIIIATLIVFVAVYGVQILIGTAQLNSAEIMLRLFKITIVLWLAIDPPFGVSAGIGMMFNFFLTFISESTRWVVSVLDAVITTETSGDVSLGVAGAGGYNPGVVATFAFIDSWIYNALTGALSPANAKVIGFFVAMAFVMPSMAIMAAYWFYSMVMMLLRTVVAFLMAIIAIAFLLGLSPIFIGFMLFQSTFQFFDQWLRFMISYSIQVMVSFAILTMWLYSLTFFAPFFNELSELIYPYKKIVRPAAAIYTPAESWGLCPMTINRSLEARCPSGFNPIPPANEGEEGNDDYKKIIPPARVPEMHNFIFYIFYHMISLIIVSYGFASLQKNAGEISRKLGGPSYIPLLNATGIGSTSFGHLKKAHQQSQSITSGGLFSSFASRHESGPTPYEKMIHSVQNMTSTR